MRKALLMRTGLAWLALTGAAGAVTVTLSPGPADPQYFAGQTIGSGDFTIGTTVWSGGGMIELGSVVNEWASPLGMGSTPHMAVQAGKTETATFATDQTSLSIYWGLIDSFNTALAVTVGAIRSPARIWHRRTARTILVPTLRQVAISGLRSADLGILRRLRSARPRIRLSSALAAARSRSRRLGP
jgi:hypothetical protein